MVLSLPPSAAVPCALYKQAWTDFKRGFTALARKSFVACRDLQADGLELKRHKRHFEYVSAECVADARRLGLLGK
jgi:hypothetical protein